MKSASEHCAVNLDTMHPFNVI